MYLATTNMMHLRGLFLLTLFLPCAAHRSIRFGESHYDAQRQTNTRTNSLAVSADAREALLPWGSGHAGALHSAFGQGTQLRTPQGQPSSLRDRSRIPPQENPLLEKYAGRTAHVEQHYAAGGPAEAPLPALRRTLPRHTAVALNAATHPDNPAATLKMARRDLLEAWTLAVLISAPVTHTVAEGLKEYLGEEMPLCATKLETLQPQLVALLRVKESIGQEMRQINTGEYTITSDEEDHMKRAVGTMLDTLFIGDCMAFNARSFAPLAKVSQATELASEACSELLRLEQHLKPKQPKQTTWWPKYNSPTTILACLGKVDKSISEFLTLMPAKVLAAAKAQVAEENKLD